MRYLPSVASSSGASLRILQSNPQQLQQLPPAVHLGYMHAYAAALQPVFFAAGCIGAVAFLLAWLIPEVALKETTRAPDTGEVYAIPSDRTSAQELERALSVLANRKGRLRSYRRLAEVAGVDLDPALCWMLIRVGQSEPISATQLAERLATSVTRLEPTLDELESKGYIGRYGETLSLLETGVLAYQRLVDAREKGLETLLHGWSPEQQLEMASTVRLLVGTDAQRRLRGGPAHFPIAPARHR